MNSAKAFVPANISCIFKIHKGVTPETTGSTGVGFTLNEGVEVQVSFYDKTKILFNEKEILFPTVESVLRVIENEVKQSQNSYLINLTSHLPLGSGFGISGASVLATVYALNNLLRLNKSKLELAKIAHIAEVENGTGLGDVTNQYFGGFLLKTDPSFMFKVYRLPIQNIPVYCKVFSKLSTKSIISGSSVNKINLAAKKAIKQIQKKKESISFAEVISISKQFALESGLLTSQKVIKTIQEVESKGGHASMIMLGNAVFADIPFEKCERFTIA